MERSCTASHPLSQLGWDAGPALPCVCGRGMHWWQGWLGAVLGRWLGAVLGHCLMLWAAYKLALKPQPDWGGFRIVLQPLDDEQRQCPGHGKNKLPPFSAQSKAKLLGSLGLQVRHEVAVSLLGVEPGSGGRTAILLCERTGCADLPNDGVYWLQRAVKICRDCCEAECRRGAVFNRGEFSGINATRMSEELMADVVVKMFCIFRQPLIKTLCM